MYVQGIRPLEHHYMNSESTYFTSSPPSAAQPCLVLLGRNLLRNNLQSYPRRQAQDDNSDLVGADPTINCHIEFVS